MKYKEKQEKLKRKGESGESYLSTDLQKNAEILQETFKDCSDVVFRPFKLGTETDALLVFVEGIVNTDEIHEKVLRSLFIHLKDAME
jgi:hypothetical protein